MRPVTITKTANIGREMKNLNVIGCLGNIISAVSTLAKEREKNEEPDELHVEEILQKVETDVDYVGDLMSLSQVQVLVMAACLERCSRFRNDLSDLADTLHISYLKLLEFNDDLEDLKKRGFMRIDKESHVSLPHAVLESFRHNKAYVKPDNKGLTTIAIMRRMRDLFELADDDQIEDMELLAEARSLIEDNPDTAFSKECRALHLDDYCNNEIQLFLYLAHKYYNDNDDEIVRSQVEEAFSSEDRCDSILSRLHDESIRLMNESVIEFVNSDGMKSRDYIHICDDVKERLFADACTISRQDQIPADIIKADKIVPHAMYYDGDVKRQVDVLSSMLSAERYGGICDSLRQKGLRTGFSCIFYGSPGTGKTETVKQLARESSRDVMMVDVSQLKSCWVGESEKNVKGLFDRYRRMVRDSAVAPILLFNEADAIFGIRKEGAQSAVDKMENSLQNIILQNMEDLDGILIATTNLTENLDKAFERRFLYKVRFERPSVEAKSKIWKSMIPDLTEDQAHILASDFDFSGGQIENISRKKLIQSVIGGSEPSFEDIRAYCSEENIVSEQPHRRIGF